MAKPIPLASREAHLHLLRTETVAGLTEAELLGRYGPLLSPAEHDRLRRYRPEKSRREYLMTRALVRTVLSRYALTAPQDWSFGANRQGRPFIEGPRLDTPLDFNLSNTDGIILCLVARIADIGVDVESTTRRAETVEIADRYFSPREVAALRALPVAAQRDRFFAYWTLKEAYIKARGMGLAIPLDEFSFNLDQPQIRIAFGPDLDDDADAWQFSCQTLSDRHVYATALRFGAEPVRIQLFDEGPPAR
jgi:4'-phosphopantetheinyl transferase